MGLHVGQMVACIRRNAIDMGSGPINQNWPSAVYPGGVYTIREIVDCTHSHGVLALRFFEYHHPPFELADGRMWETAFPAPYFRPLDRPADISIFTQVLDDVNAGRVREIAGA